MTSTSRVSSRDRPPALTTVELFIRLDPIPTPTFLHSDRQIEMKLTASVVLLTSLLITCTPPAAAGDPGKLLLHDGDREVLTYNAEFIPSPDVDQPYFGRSGFIHPVRTPSGRIVTEGFPADHLHQHGLMFAWTSAVVGGHEVDFWNSRKQQGLVEHVETITSGGDEIRVRLRHVDTSTEGRNEILREQWRITRISHPSVNVFDLLSSQTCVAPTPLEIKQFHYGAMCVRGPSAWLGDQVAMITDEGKNRVAGNHSRPRWVTMQGVIDDARCGLVAMSHPENFRAPQPVRLHPTKPYFCFAPMVTGDFQIEPGEPYVSRYRFVAFDGELDAGELDSIWDDFTDSANR